MSGKDSGKPKTESRDSEVSSGEQNCEDPQGSGNGAHHDSDIFSLFSAMNSGFIGNQIHPAAVHVLASRKRKFFDQSGGHFGSGKLFGGVKGSAFRRNSEDDHPLHTPQCSQSGYADEEDRRHHLRELEQDQGGRRGSANILSEIDDHLASDFDGSLSGLGVDISSSTYSMSEALLALPSLSISASHLFKQEIPSPQSHLSHLRLSSTSQMKKEPDTLSSSLKGKSPKRRTSPQTYGALDLSNDEAAHFPENDSSEETVILGPKTFTGSVSRSATPFQQNLTTSASHHQLAQLDVHGSLHLSSHLSVSQPNLTTIGLLPKDEVAPSSGGISTNQVEPIRSHKVILPLQNSLPPPRKDSNEQMQNESNASSVGSANVDGNFYQIVLNASTSIATKITEPSITYLNQGQAYELSLKKLNSTNKRLYCQLRICFHERRLQNMEMEQIAEWIIKHPGERILDIDLPLSYGITEPIRDSSNVNTVSFRWDASKDAAIFVRVHCISTEFTPKKHGGEKGVPFRLQVELFDQDGSRVYVGGCILQVFKLKGADRKHKQDRDKIQKRPSIEQEKYAKQSDRTILTPLPQEYIFNRVSSRSVSPDYVSYESGSIPPSRTASREEPTLFSVESHYEKECPAPTAPVSSTVPYQNSYLSPNASVEQVVQWLSRNRYGSLVASFRNYMGRDLLRLSRDDVISVCGLTDGVRLYNDLHMVSIIPRLTFYVALKGTDVYDAIFIEEPTMTEFQKRLSAVIGIETSNFGTIFKKTWHGVHVRFTEAVLLSLRNESVFLYSIRNLTDDKCDIFLEDAPSLSEDGLHLRENYD